MESIYYYQAAVPTAFYSNEQLNVNATLKHVEYLATKGVRSVLLCGSTGEQRFLIFSRKNRIGR